MFQNGANQTDEMGYRGGDAAGQSSLQIQTRQRIVLVLGHAFHQTKHGRRAVHTCQRAAAIVKTHTQTNSGTFSEIELDQNARCAR